MGQLGQSKSVLTRLLIACALALLAGCNSAPQTSIDKAHALYAAFEPLKGDFSSTAVGNDQIDAHIAEAKFALDNFADKATPEEKAKPWAKDFQDALAATNDYVNQRKLLQVERDSTGHETDSRRMALGAAVNKVLNLIDRAKMDVDRDEKG